MNEQVLFRQRLCRQAGMYDGELDGLCGPKTAKADREWQMVHFELAINSMASDRSRLLARGLLPAVAAVALKILDAFYVAREAKWRDKGAGRPRTIGLVSGTRTYAEQDALWKQGRTTPGKRVTNAKAGQSNHNFGLAFDVGLFNSDESYVRLEAPYYEFGVQLVSDGFLAANNLTWGGLWPEKKRDLPHYELDHGLAMSEVRRRFEAGEMIIQPKAEVAR